jgi:hypothetical protein
MTDSELRDTLRNTASRLRKTAPGELYESLAKCLDMMNISSLSGRQANAISLALRCACLLGEIGVEVD